MKPTVARSIQLTPDQLLCVHEGGNCPGSCAEDCEQAGKARADEAYRQQDTGDSSDDAYDDD